MVAGLPEAGDDYSAPRVVQRAVEEEACGAPSEGWAGLYCPAGRTLVIDLDAHARRHGVIGQGFSELLLGYIVAHEMGHHVQTLRGAPDTGTLENARQHELHAECLAGVWGRAAGVPLPPPWAYAEDAVHGTVQEQIQWLNAGYRAGRPADCDAIWSGSTSP
ncbi:MAG TPA: neutral zinc metallopeptidase [Solirubrobacteraceae bacterium]